MVGLKVSPDEVRSLPVNVVETRELVGVSNLEIENPKMKIILEVKSPRTGTDVERESPPNGINIDEVSKGFTFPTLHM